MIDFLNLEIENEWCTSLAVERFGFNKKKSHNEIKVKPSPLVMGAAASLVNLAVDN